MTRALAVIADFFSGARVIDRSTMQITKILTKRQLEVMLLTASGLTDWQIANQLLIHKSAITKHQDNIRRRLGAQNRTQVTIICYENNLLPPNLNQKFRLELTA